MNLVSAALVAAVLSVGLAGVAQAAPASEGWGGTAVVKPAKTVDGLNGLRRTPRM